MKSSLPQTTVSFTEYFMHKNTQINVNDEIHASVDVTYPPSITEFSMYMIGRVVHAARNKCHRSLSLQCL